MSLLISRGFDGYELLDTGAGEKLERFGQYRVSRPDPQILWRRKNTVPWDADAVFSRTAADRGTWSLRRPVPDPWIIRYRTLRFRLKLTPFKHLGIFPEQASQWEWVMASIAAASRPVHMLNLFGYTGALSLAAAASGADVTHVDASRPTIGWARENQHLSGLGQAPVRWILDDAVSFCRREIKRGAAYEAIVMDPPVRGHGPHGELWDFTAGFPRLMGYCRQLLAPKPLFILINAYAVSTSSVILDRVLEDETGGTGNIISGELGMRERVSGRILTTGIFAAWSPDADITSGILSRSD